MSTHETMLNALSVAYDALGELAGHSAFEDDAPEFNEGGCGYEARRLLRQVLDNEKEKI
jgi:hypothetical protein